MEPRHQTIHKTRRRRESKVKRGEGIEKRIERRKQQKKEGEKEEGEKKEREKRGE